MLMTQEEMRDRPYSRQPHNDVRDDAQHLQPPCDPDIKQVIEWIDAVYWAGFRNGKVG